jgi:hypothetical protein
MITTRRHSVFLCLALAAGGVLGWTGGLHVAHAKAIDGYKFLALRDHMRSSQEVCRDELLAREPALWIALLDEQGPEVLRRTLEDRVEMNALAAERLRTMTTDAHRERVAEARRELRSLIEP